MMLSAQRLHQPFPDEIDCVKFISICKATEEKINFFNQQFDNPNIWLDPYIGWFHNRGAIK